MASFNRVVLVGNMTRDPEVKYLPSGSAVCEISLAVNREWFDKTSGQKKTDVTYVDVTYFGKIAEVLGEYTVKGSPILVEGRLSMDSWQDKATGQKRSKLKVVGETMQLLGSRNADRQQTAEPQQERQQPRAKPQEQPESPQWESASDYGGPSDDVPF